MKRTIVVFGALVLAAALALPSTASAHKFPSGAVISFNLKNCPPDWKEYGLAYGKFVRGIDRGNEKIDPDGEREPGSFQDDIFASHDHARPKDVYDARGGPDSEWVENGKYFAYGHTKPPRTGLTGGGETRPVNVALLFCEKM